MIELSAEWAGRRLDRPAPYQRPNAVDDEPERHEPELRLTGPLTHAELHDLGATITREEYHRRLADG